MAPAPAPLLGALALAQFDSVGRGDGARYMVSVTVAIRLTRRCRGAAIPARVCQGRRSAAVFIAAVCERRALSV